MLGAAAAHRVRSFIGRIMTRLMSAISALALLLFGSAAFAATQTAPIDNLEQAAAALAKLSGQSVRPYSTRDFGREEYPAARSIIVAAQAAPVVLKKIRAMLGPHLVAFIGTERNLADNAQKGVEIVVGIGNNQFDILRIAASDAINYGMETGDLIAHLQRWDLDFGIDIYAAQTDSVQLRLRSKPRNIKAFAEEVYEFCPDIVDQGIGSVAALAAEIEKSGEVYLWWD